jgi:hypothetical protein
LKDVDELLGHMGSRMSSISFGDLDPEYITKNFKELLTTIDSAEKALSSGLSDSF